MFFAPVAVRRKVVEPVVLVSPVKSTVCSVNAATGLLIVRMLLKPEPLSYDRMTLVGPFEGLGLAT